MESHPSRNGTVPIGPVLNKAGFYAPNIIFVVLSFVFVLLRLWSRRIQRLKYDISDYFIITAFGLSLLVSVAAYVGVANGAGEHVDYLDYIDPSQHKVVELLKILMLALIPYLLSLMFSRLSILLLYRSIFPSQFMQFTTVALATLVVMINVSAVFVTVFSCRPIDGFWLVHVMDKPPQCINTFNLYLALSLSSMLMDIACLLLPIRDIVRMQLRRRDKVTVLGMFFMGGLTIVVTAPRTVFLAKGDGNDISYWSANIALWTTIETAVAIICVCLPILRPVLRRVRAMLGLQSLPASDSTDPAFFESWQPGESRNFQVRAKSVASLRADSASQDPWIYDVEKLSTVIELKVLSEDEDEELEETQKKDIGPVDGRMVDDLRRSHDTVRTIKLFPNPESASTLIPQRCVSKYNKTWPGLRGLQLSQLEGPVFILDLESTAHLEPPRKVQLRQERARGQEKVQAWMEEGEGRSWIYSGRNRDWNFF